MARFNCGPWPIRQAVSRPSQGHLGSDTRNRYVVWRTILSRVRCSPVTRGLSLSPISKLRKHLHRSSSLPTHSSVMSIHRTRRSLFLRSAHSATGAWSHLLTEMPACRSIIGTVKSRSTILGKAASAMRRASSLGVRFTARTPHHLRGKELIDFSGDLLYTHCSRAVIKMAQCAFGIIAMRRCVAASWISFLAPG